MHLQRYYLPSRRLFLTKATELLLRDCCVVCCLQLLNLAACKKGGAALVAADGLRMLLGLLMGGTLQLSDSRHTDYMNVDVEADQIRAAAVITNLCTNTDNQVQFVIRWHQALTGGCCSCWWAKQD